MSEQKNKRYIQIFGRLCGEHNRQMQSQIRFLLIWISLRITVILVTVSCQKCEHVLKAEAIYCKEILYVIPD